MLRIAGTDVAECVGPTGHPGAELLRELTYYCRWHAQRLQAGPVERDIDSAAGCLVDRPGVGAHPWEQAAQPRAAVLGVVNTDEGVGCEAVVVAVGSQDVALLVIRVESRGGGWFGAPNSAVNARCRSAGMVWALIAKAINRSRSSRLPRTWPRFAFG